MTLIVNIELNESFSFAILDILNFYKSSKNKNTDMESITFE